MRDHLSTFGEYEYLGLGRVETLEFVRTHLTAGQQAVLTPVLEAATDIWHVDVAVDGRDMAVLHL